MDFRALPSGDYTMTNISVPACLLGKEGDLIRTEISVSGGKIAEPQAMAVDMEGAIVLPAFVDMHAHLDKGHIWPRAANPDGTFMGALNTVASDRAANWSADDVRARMDFSLRCAFAHGTRAIRTHLDSIPPQHEISWPVFREMRSEWADRIALQAACLVGCEHVEEDGSFSRTADIVAESGGVLGMVAYPIPDLEDRIHAFFRLAEDRGLDVDFHVDETTDPDSEALRALATCVIEEGYQSHATVGHACSLANQDPDRAHDTLDLIARAQMNVVSLPMCNLYLQDRQAGRTPRWRGITLVHEMKARGINVSFASDNTRDPFYAYGDMDMIEVMREATRIGHLDHSDADWAHAFSTNPAKACGFAAPSFDVGAAADLIVCKARSWTEFFARPQSDRIVLRDGLAIDRTLPDFSELDSLMEQA